MDLRKKIKNFFTLTRKANAGFTLVELIVVIAILAILGGVAVPAYSGYVKKAERSADEALLNEINTAFASACMANGESNYGRKDVKGGITAKKFVYTEPFATEFASFFDSEDAEFKAMNSLVYDLDLGGFKDPSVSDTLTLAYGNGFVKVTGAAIAALKESAYYGEGMDSEILLKQVASVAGIAGPMGTITNVRNTESYVNAALDALGLETSGTLDEKVARMNQRARELALKELNLTEDQVNSDNQAQVFAKMNEIGNNALVLYAAQSTSNMKVTEAKNMLKDVNSSMIKDAMDNGTDDVKAKGMNQAALAYGMYFAYVNSDACTDDSLKREDHVIEVDEVIAALDDTDGEFRRYMDSAQGTKDMEAYLQALGVINSSTESTEAVEKLVVKGFSDPDLIAILTQTMGK